MASSVPRTFGRGGSSSLAPYDIPADDYWFAEDPREDGPRLEKVKYLERYLAMRHRLVEAVRTLAVWLMIFVS